MAAGRRDGCYLLRMNDPSDTPSIVGVPHYLGDDPALTYTSPDFVGGEFYYGQLYPEMFMVWFEMGRRRPPSSTIPKCVESSTGDPEERMEVSVRARLHNTYLQLAEALFAHFFANVQAPELPSAWLSAYNNKQLMKMVGQITERPWKVTPSTSALGEPDRLVRWLFGLPPPREGEPSELTEEASAIQDLITLLAADFASSTVTSEYNVMKHGIRGVQWSYERRRAFWGQREPDPNRLTGPDAPQGVEILYLKGLGKSQYAMVHRLSGRRARHIVDLGHLSAQLLFNLVASRGDHKYGGGYSFKGRVPVWKEDDHPRLDTLEVAPDIDARDHDALGTTVEEAAKRWSEDFLKFLRQ